MYGADINALEALATSMDDAAARLDMIARTLGRQLGGSPWRGGDADGFRGAWEGRLLGSIHRAGAALHDAARQLRTNADQQRQASTSVGSGSRSAVSVGPGGSPGSPGQGTSVAVVPSGGGPGWWDRVVVAGGYAGLFSGAAGLPSAALDAVSIYRGVVPTGLGPLSVLDFGVETIDLIEEIRAKGFTSWGTVGHLLSTVVTVTPGPVGLIARTGVTSFQVGGMVGGLLDDQFNTSQNFVDATSIRRYGTTELTPAQAADLTNRLEGPGAFLNYANDVAHNAGSAIANTAKKIWPW